MTVLPPLVHSTPQPPLTRAQANEVLRYWLASLQQEEALSTRPKARKPLVGTHEPRIDAPSAGHEYFKLPLDAAFESLLCDKTERRLTFDAELSAFFETWLASQYRRSDQDRDLSHLLAFPVVHLPRGELAGLLRFNLRVRFGNPGGSQFEVPSWGERRRKQFPPAPVEARLLAVDRSARQWPFFVDTRLLHQQLGVARESIDALFATLRQQEELEPRQMLGMICGLLEAELAAAEGDALAEAISGGLTRASDAAPGQLLERISSAMSRLLARSGGRARVYPVGVVFDGTRAKTTWHLQREMQALLDERAEVAWDLDSCLGAYLTSGPQVSGMAVHRTLFPAPPLSKSQLLAAERCWGSRLTAVQGPPGTGKTTLILHMAAEALVRQVDKLANDGAMGDGLLVVTSTNNRAVDNVVDPLIALRPDGLPLALRAGSQKVCEQLLAPKLAAARAWLDHARLRPQSERDATLTAALDEFKRVRAEVGQVLAPRALCHDAESTRGKLGYELARLAADGGGSVEPVLAPSAVAALTKALAAARKKLDQLCNLCGATPGLTQLSAVDRQYKACARRELPALEEASAAAGAPIELGLPPSLPPSTDPAVLMEAWQEAAEAALARVEALQVRAKRSDEDARNRKRRHKLQQELDALGTEQPIPDAHDIGLQSGLFDAAVTVREAWAAANAEALAEAVAIAHAAARSDYSLRPVWSDDRDSWKLLRQLFGVWGCTLLSLGNCFPAQRGGIERLIIDEAGQCHPTYAISGLLRTHAALIIGDVHQLEPVIDLEPDDDARVIETCKLTLSTQALAPYRVHSQAQCSVQALADRAVSDRPRLIDHFRCQPEIIAISDALCSYGLQVHTPHQDPTARLPFLPHPVSLIDVAGEQERLGGSWHNPAELALTLELFHALMNAGVDPRDVAVITPYRGQLEQLRRQFVRLGIPIDQSMELLDLGDPTPAADGGTALGTVHRFQGGERSIVLFSSVVTRRSSLGFLDDRENLLNVAVSRARHRFVALGSRALLASGRRTALLARAAAEVVPESFRAQLGLQL